MPTYTFDGTWQEDEYPCASDACGLDDALHMIATEWGLPMIGILMGGAARHVHNLTKRIFGSRPDFHYFRFETLVDEDMPMDEADEENFGKMDEVVNAYLNDIPGDYDEIRKRRNLYDMQGYLFGKNLRKLKRNWS